MSGQDNAYGAASLAAPDAALARPNFDVAALRSLVAGVDLGSFAKAADRVARSSSAVSAQIRKLEEQAGTPLFVKAGRGLALTDAGDAMLRYARRMIELNDEAAAAVRGVNLDGWVRVGLQEDFGEAILPDVLGRFARAHPKVRIEARVARNAELLERLDANQLDLALVWGDPASATLVSRAGIDSDAIAQVPMQWIAAVGAAGFGMPDGGGPADGGDDGDASLRAMRASAEPLPLVVFDRPCRFFGAATDALDRAGVPWRVAFTTPSLAGLWAAASAGLGLTVRSHYGLPASVRVLDAASFGLPELPSLPLMLLRRTSSATPTVERLARIVTQAVRDATQAEVAMLAA
ncbi:bacterial regulatory helix-turn-helix, lysR family protein [Burkholderia ambifaria AMMD]|uniref:Transcriptional regulator, LysR family n=1 Tax=Burkholderia ambifaria (strain ATCC BAA-244 / DSM 16087 / CCUG 44356 / LMG 19182 / AMMD) TaxID=339670 RepID=Q0BBC3_BURCM|nr:LysR substrate-binding domain-containing protein [Burkholderia ambifaria]ABI88550.1 transcriptional regulator, LysR family [Burkholderia ambifaria AMMD]AJY21575.1 bacterial regulatory helix-turn-helix, lysR family protein [Burkholderia ambifaria AMMD]MBR7931333.1 LysR family transcriptional regulator [Burkholderia ambifaria]PEH64323.1 LysR family transcriptional regulator [Burkholderia ambifaria]QQC04273.1 LysR family transcriptional regulator [Burkholderia ambifaria]